MKNLESTKVSGKGGVLLLEVRRRNKNPNSDYIIIIDNVAHSVSRVKRIFNILKEKNEVSRHKIYDEITPRLNCLLEWSNAVRLGETTWEARNSDESRSIFIKTFISKAVGFGHKILNEVEDMKSLKNVMINDFFKLIGLFSYPSKNMYHLVDNIEFFCNDKKIDSTEV